MAKLMRVDDSFDKYIKKFQKELEEELGFSPPRTSLTKTITTLLNESELTIKNGKRKTKRKDWNVIIEM